MPSSCTVLLTFSSSSFSFMLGVSYTWNWFCSGIVSDRIELYSSFCKYPVSITPLGEDAVFCQVCIFILEKKIWQLQFIYLNLYFYFIWKHLTFCIWNWVQFWWMRVSLRAPHLSSLWYQSWSAFRNTIIRREATVNKTTALCVNMSKRQAKYDLSCSCFPCRVLAPEFWSSCCFAKTYSSGMN